MISIYISLNIVLYDSPPTTLTWLPSATGPLPWGTEQLPFVAGPPNSHGYRGSFQSKLPSTRCPSSWGRWTEHGHKWHGHTHKLHEQYTIISVQIAVTRSISLALHLHSLRPVSTGLNDPPLPLLQQSLPCWRERRTQHHLVIIDARMHTYMMACAV